MRPVAVLRNGISKRKAVLPSCEAESDAGEVRDNGRIPEIARSMPVLAVCYRQFCIVLHYSRTKEPFQGATADRKVAGDTGRQISRGKDALTNRQDILTDRRMTFFRLPPAYCLTPFWGWNRHSLSVFHDRISEPMEQNPNPQRKDIP